MDRRANQMLSLYGAEESSFEQLEFIESNKKDRTCFTHIESLSSLIHYITLCRSYIFVDTLPWCTYGRLRELIIKPQGWNVLVSTITSDSSAHLCLTRHRWQKNVCATGRKKKNMTQLPAAWGGNSEGPRGTLVLLHLCFAWYLCFPSVSHLLRFLSVSSSLCPSGHVWAN